MCILYMLYKLSEELEVTVSDLFKGIAIKLKQMLSVNKQMTISLFINSLSFYY